MNRTELVRHLHALAAAGKLPPAALARALALAAPSSVDWRRFLERLLAALGGLLCLAGVVYFVAWNWAELPRLVKLGVLEAGLVLLVLAADRLGLARLPGRLALLLAALGIGPLLAAYGQIYQTGADGYALFRGWALLMLPWVLVGQSAALWLAWLAVADAALVLWGLTHYGFEQAFYGVPQQALLALNLAALAGWELVLRHRRGSRLGPRLIVAAAALQLTVLALSGIFDDAAPRWIAPVCVAAAVAAAVVYRRVVPDLHPLACLAAALVVTITAGLGEALLEADHDLDIAEWLLLALAVVGQSALVGRVLRQLARELPR